MTDRSAAARVPDLFAFMGGDDAFLHLVVQKDIVSYADVKGRVLSVDALSTGFTFVLRKILESGGLSEEDYELQRAGGVLQRWEDLKRGKHAGTLLLTPFEILAENVPGMNFELANRAYKIFVSKDRGFEPQARLDLEGVQAVLELPSRYGVPRKALSAAREYYDLSYYELAFASDYGAIAVAPEECDVPGAPKQDRPRSKSARE